jgi:TonB family protein
MNTYLNYIIEANAGLCIVLLVYYTLLAKETDFKLLRQVMLVGVFSSLTFPLIHFNGTTNFVPTVDDYIPTYWLPEIVVGTTSDATPLIAANDYWNYIAIVYSLGVGLFLALFLVQLWKIIQLTRRHIVQRHGKFLIAHTNTDTPSFSFFHFIFIGKDSINDHERNQIIRHEMAHGEQLHSFDILLLNILAVFFWFNPLLRLYKKIFVQLHEFEADARAVANQEVNDYCSLLARVALKSADFNIASHFNQSLTLKRINMMRTFKTKIKKWKLVAAAAVAPLFFVAIACQDQVADDLNKIANNSNAALLVPANVQARYDQLKKENPNSTYVMIQPTEEAMQTLKNLEARYGLPKSVEVFTPSKTGSNPGKMDSMKIQPWTNGNENAFIIIEYNDQVKQLTESAANSDEVYVVVEQMPQYVGGVEALGGFIANNLTYPKDASSKGIEGTVMIQFIVNKDGSVSDVNVLKGISVDCDKEAVRVVEAMPNWVAGKQNGKTVKVKYVVPIKFKIG